jgi:hypothetical protein
MPYAPSRQELEEGKTPHKRGTRVNEKQPERFRQKHIEPTPHPTELSLRVFWRPSVCIRLTLTLPTVCKSEPRRHFHPEQSTRRLNSKQFDHAQENATFLVALYRARSDSRLELNDLVPLLLSG